MSIFFLRWAHLKTLTVIFFYHYYVFSFEIVHILERHIKITKFYAMAFDTDINVKKNYETLWKENTTTTS